MGTQVNKETLVKKVITNKIFNTTKKVNKVVINESKETAKKEIHKLSFCYNEIRKNLNNELKQIFRSGNKDENKFFFTLLLNEIGLNDFLRLSKNGSKFSLSNVANYMVEFSTKVKLNLISEYLGKNSEMYENSKKIESLIFANNEVENFEVNKNTLLEILPLLSKYLTKKEIEILNSFEIDIVNFQHLIKETTKNVSKQKSLEIENARLLAQINELLNNSKNLEIA